MFVVYVVGVMKVLVRIGWGEFLLIMYRNKWKEMEFEYIVEDILDVVYWII